MTGPMTINEIERRLRFAAPDEPTVLPPLALPTTSGIVRASVRLRSGAARHRDARFVYAMLALLLALALAIAVGAERLLDRRDQLVTTCDPMIAGLEECLPVAVPEGWVNLGEGQFQSGEFAEPGLGSVFVQQVMATTPLGACPTPGGPFPAAVPSGSGEYVEVPLPTPDAGLACLRAAQLPDNAVRIVTFRGGRILGGDAETGGIPDHSEPTPEAGWTETVAGRPARLTIVGGAAGGPAETRIWDVLWPGSIGTVLRLRADIAGPDLEAGRAKAQQVVDAVDFKWDVPALDQADADAVLGGLLDLLDRSLREGSHSDLYGCFPRKPGSAEATIRGSDSGPLAAPLQVACSSRIEASIAQVWRITLEVTWPAGDGYAGDTLRLEYFSAGHSAETGAVGVDGGYTTSLAGRTPNWDDPGFSWFPNGGLVLPDPLDGPLNIPPGSLARVLAPGESGAAEPAAGGDEIYPGIVGTNVWVLEGPTLVDGEEWYRVQSGTGFPPEAAWMRGTRDGRPQLQVIEPHCPAGDAVTVGELMWLISAERVLCFGDREITIERGVFGFEPGYASSECMADDGAIGPCPTATADWGWIAGNPSWSLFGAGGRHGPEPPLLVWLTPGVAAPQDGEAVRVRGHFDDPAAHSCGLIENEGFAFGQADDDELQVLVCRERFVITSIERL